MKRPALTTLATLTLLAFGQSAVAQETKITVPSMPVIVVKPAPLLRGGTNTGGNDAPSVLPSYGWCTSVVQILRNALSKAEAQKTEGNTVGAMLLLKAGLENALVAKGIEIPAADRKYSLTFKSIKRGLELAKLLMTPVSLEPPYRDAGYVLITNYYDFIDNTARNLDVSHWLAYKTGACRTDCFNQSFDERYDRFALEQLGWVINGFLCQPSRSFRQSCVWTLREQGWFPLWDERTYFKVLAKVANDVASDFNDAVFPTKWACIQGDLLGIATDADDYVNGNAIFPNAQSAMKSITDRLVGEDPRGFDGIYTQISKLQGCNGYRRGN